jgi:hypothetical protein
MNAPKAEEKAEKKRKAEAEAVIHEEECEEKCHSPLPCSCYHCLEYVFRMINFVLNLGLYFAFYDNGPGGVAFAIYKQGECDCDNSGPDIVIDTPLTHEEMEGLIETFLSRAWTDGGEKDWVDWFHLLPPNPKNTLVRDILSPDEFNKLKNTHEYYYLRISYRAEFNISFDEVTVRQFVRYLTNSEKPTKGRFLFMCRYNHMDIPLEEDIRDVLVNYYFHSTVAAFNGLINIKKRKAEEE